MQNNINAVEKAKKDLAIEIAELLKPTIEKIVEDKIKEFKDELLEAEDCDTCPHADVCVEASVKNDEGNTTYKKEHATMQDIVDIIEMLGFEVKDAKEVNLRSQGAKNKEAEKMHDEVDDQLEALMSFINESMMTRLNKVSKAYAAEKSELLEFKERYSSLLNMAVNGLGGQFAEGAYDYYIRTLDSLKKKETEIVTLRRILEGLTAGI